MTTVPAVPATSAALVAPAQERRAPAPPPPSPEQVVLLQAVRSYPAVSVLLNTTPARAMTAADAARLRGLVDLAARRLRAEAPKGKEPALVADLHRLADRAAAAPTGTAVALFASSGTAEHVALPLAVRERVVVDPTFATRDLVRSLHRTPRHLVLSLSSREARLFVGVGETLRPVPGNAFPMRSDRLREAGEASSRAARRKVSDVTAFWRSVDAALGAYLRAAPVAVGPRRPGPHPGRVPGVSRNLGAPGRAASPPTWRPSRWRAWRGAPGRSWSPTCAHARTRPWRLLERRAGAHRGGSRAAAGRRRR
jgi:hypothetical protein